MSSQQNEKNTFDRITEMANERFNLYRTAGKEHLTPNQLQRLHQIDNELPQLWDLHRREIASKQWGRRDSAPSRYSERDIA